MEHLSDQEILHGCISEDMHYREAFVRLFSDFVYKTVQYTLKTKTNYNRKMEVEDLHNTVFVKLFEKRCHKLRQYKGKNGCSLASWIRLITIRTVIDYIRKTNTDALSKQKNDDYYDIIDNLEANSPDPFTLMNKTEQHHLIQKGLTSLKPRDRIFIKLHFINGLSIHEVAKAMNITETNAHTIKHRAVKRLKETIFNKTNYSKYRTSAK